MFVKLLLYSVNVKLCGHVDRNKCSEENLDRGSTNIENHCPIIFIFTNSILFGNTEINTDYPSHVPLNVNVYMFSVHMNLKKIPNFY